METTPTTEPPTTLTEALKERFLKSRFCPPHIRANPAEWGVIWMGGNSFLFYREFNITQTWKQQ